MRIISDKIVITRKEHYCDACLRKFPKGTKMRTQVNVYDEINTWRECLTCQVLLSEHRECFAEDDDIAYEGCVNNSLQEGETPEMLLEKLKHDKSHV